MGLFKTAAAKKADTPKAKKKATTWLVGDPNSQQIGNSVHELITLDAQKKAIDAKMEVHKTAVCRFAKNAWFRDVADLGVPPETPLKVQNHDGESVSFVVQDRSAQYAVKEEQREALTQLLGADAVNDLLYEEVTFGFDRALLANPRVQEVVEAALESAIGTLQEEGILGDEDSLITADTKVAFKPKTLDRLAALVGRDVNRLESFVRAMGSSAVMYVRV